VLKRRNHNENVERKFRRSFIALEQGMELLLPLGQQYLTS
jgi:hypothetical protein